MSAKVETKVFLTGPNGPQDGPTTTAELTQGEVGTLSGSGDANGSSATKTVPDGDDVTTTEDSYTSPPGTSLIRVEVKASHVCPDGTTLSLSGSGNVSATGSFDGRCIRIRTVQRDPGQNGKVTTTTTERKRCCPERGAKAAPKKGEPKKGEAKKGEAKKGKKERG